MLVRRRAALRWGSSTIRRVSTESQRRFKDEGDWFYSSEWWGDTSEGNTVFRSTSGKGNGVVAVVAHPSSVPSGVHWGKTERWLQQRYAEICPGEGEKNRLRILGYQWRVLRFNDITRQSTVKVLAAYRQSEPASVHLMQQSHCLAVPYLKSMVSVGFATIAACDYNVMNVARGSEKMHILCIGHGGGSLPLYLASKIEGAVVDIVEIDPLVISASIRAMGFPAFSVTTPSGERLLSKPSLVDNIMWKGIHERLFLYESDAEDFILNSSTIYDMVFIDAYDGDDIFPRKLWDPQSPFLEALRNRLHPKHGTVVVNLHSDCDLLGPDGSVQSILQPVLPMGKYIARVCRAYKEVLTGTGKKGSPGGEVSGLGFTVSVPWVCNSSLVMCRGFGKSSEHYNNIDSILNTLIGKSLEVERVLDLPFSCLQYINRGFVLV